MNFWTNPTVCGLKNCEKILTKCQKCTIQDMYRNFWKNTSYIKLKLTQIEENRWADSFFCFIINQNVNKNASGVIKIHKLAALIFSQKIMTLCFIILLKFRRRKWLYFFQFQPFGWDMDILHFWHSPKWCFYKMKKPPHHSQYLAPSRKRNL